MNWVNLHQDWGFPAVNLFLARPFLDVSPLQSLFGMITEDEASRERVEQWVQHLFADHYAGVQVSGLHWMPHLDALVLTVIHPRFPRTKAYAALPQWHILVHEADTERPWYSVEECGA